MPASILTTRELLHTACILAAFGCGGGGGGGCSGGGGGQGGGGGGCNGGGNELTFTDPNNYAFSSGFATTPIEIEAQADATADWSAMTTDIRGRPVDPATVQQVSLLNITAPLDEVSRMIAENEIGQDDAQDIYLFENTAGATSVALSDFAISDTDIDLSLLVESAETTWVMSLMNVPGGRTDILATALILPKVDVPDHEIAFTDGLSELTDLQVDIAGAEPLRAEAGAVPSMDWSGVTQDTFGHPFDSLLADELIIGHYAGDVASVEAEFLQLDTIADELYRLDVFGVTGEDLAGATDADGNSFQGFTTDGTWLVGIVCRSCATPVPLILGHVVVE